jgi:hypothetical protein
MVSVCVNKLEVHTENGTLPRSSQSVLVIEELVVLFTIKQDASLIIFKNGASSLRGFVIIQNLRNIDDSYFIAVASNMLLHSSFNLLLSSAKIQTDGPASIILLNSIKLLIFIISITSFY